MPITILVLLGVLGLALLLNGRRESAASSDPDEATLAELGKAGSNLAQPHEIEFFLYFPTQRAADDAGTQLRGEGFSVEVTPGEDTEDWLCLATRTLRPTIDELQRLRRYLNAVAGSREGAYDGWGTTITNQGEDE
jgi:hypothetical protein